MLQISSGFQTFENNKTTWPVALWFQLFLAFGNLIKPSYSDLMKITNSARSYLLEVRIELTMSVQYPESSEVGLKKDLNFAESLPLKDTWRNSPRDEGVFYIFLAAKYLKMLVFQDLLVSYCLRNIIRNENFHTKIWIVIELCGAVFQSKLLSGYRNNATCIGLDDCSPFCVFFILCNGLSLSRFM